MCMKNTNGDEFHFICICHLLAKEIMKHLPSDLCTQNVYTFKNVVQYEDSNILIKFALFVKDLIKKCQQLLSHHHTVNNSCSTWSRTQLYLVIQMVYFYRSICCLYFCITKIYHECIYWSCYTREFFKSPALYRFTDLVLTWHVCCLFFIWVYWNSCLKRW